MNQIPLNDLSRITSDEVITLTELFREICGSGSYLKGDFTKQLEKALSSIFQNETTIAVANGTDALTLAIAALQLSSSDRVAIVPNAGGYSSISLRRLGLSCSYIDIDPITAQMSVNSLTTALEADPSIRAVIVTHLYGMCGEIEEIASLCQSFKVALIEDCAQSIGAQIAGRSVGTFGDMATLSFYPTKNLGALGDGGAVVCKNPKTAQLVNELAQYGWSSRYVIDSLNGFNSRIDEIQAAIICSRLPFLPEMNSTRKKIINRYSDSLKSPRRIINASGQNFVGHLAIMVTPKRESDAQFLQSAGIATSIHYPLLDPEQPAWSSQEKQWRDLIPNAIDLNAQILTLPCFPTMRDDEITKVCDTLSTLQ
jgi:dTDP-4-amino-4,6-dideoxygalactose transaminase